MSTCASRSDTQNLLYYHSQFAFPVSRGASIQQRRRVLSAGDESGFITGPVFPDMHSIFLNVEFSY